MKRLIAIMFSLMLLMPSLALAQVTTLLGTGDNVSVILAGAATTTEPTYSVLWEGAGGPSTAMGVTTGATGKTMLSGVAGSGPRIVKQVTLHNSDTAAVTVTLRKTTGGTTYPIGKYVLPSLSTLCFTDQQVRVTDNNGQQATTTTDFGSVGAAAATGNAATETTNGFVRRTKLTLSAVSVTMVDATVQGGGVKIYDFPEGRIQILGVTGSMAMTTTSILANTLNTGVTCNWGVGTVVQVNPTVATTEQDLLPVTAWTAGTTINVANTATVGALVATTQFDGTTTAKDAYLNLGVAGATDIDADATVTCTGTINITWILLGDY